MESASCLAGLIARKPTLLKLSLGEMAYDSRKTTELDVPVAAAAVLTWGGDIAADRKAHTGTFVSAFGIGRACSSCEQRTPATGLKEVQCDHVGQNKTRAWSACKQLSKFLVLHHMVSQDTSAVLEEKKRSASVLGG